MKNIKSTAIMIATAILLVACGGGGGGGSTGGGGNAIVDRDLTLNRPNPEPVFAGYSAPSIFTVSVTNSRTTDNTTVAAVSTGSCTATASAVNNGNATITVTPTATSGLCEVAVTATEDDRESNEESFTFTLSEIAPLISVAGQNSPYAPTAVLADGTITINLTATKQDISNSDVEFAVASNPGGCIIAGLSGTTSYTGAPFFVPLPNTATATQDITISLPGGQGGTCEIEFTATENGQVSAPFIVDANFYPPRIVVAAGAARINLPAIPGTTHEVTIIATKQDMSDIAEVTFTAAFVGNSQYCDVAVANPRASYVGGGAGGIGSMATTNITVSYSGPLSSITQCQVNVAVTEGTKTSNLPFINGLNSAMYVQFVSVNQPPLLGLSDVPTGTPFPDERPRIGVRATKQDTVPSGVVNSEVMVINGACMATLDGEDLSYDIRVSRFGSSSSDAYYNISLDAANAISAVAADRQCEIEFSVTETETIPRRVDGFSYPAGIKNTANRTITFNFAQEMPPLFVNISTPGGNSVTYPSHRKAMVHITLQKQDASSTEIITLPPSINSTGDVCTAT
ncbi:MAG: hypothetical protein K0U41_03480 [Gammaproteobacteria bacterium]|nr:hypothetical protein [Gammaproteobacteria bacterium]